MKLSRAAIIRPLLLHFSNKSVVKPRPVSLLSVKGGQFVSGSPYAETGQISQLISFSDLLATQFVMKCRDQPRGKEKNWLA